MQNQKTVSAYFANKQILYFGFSEQISLKYHYLVDLLPPSSLASSDQQIYEYRNIISRTMTIIYNLNSKPFYNYNCGEITFHLTPNIELIKQKPRPWHLLINSREAEHYTDRSILKQVGHHESVFIAPPQHVTTKTICLQ